MRAPRGVPVVVLSRKCEQASEREGEGESTGDSVEVVCGEGDGGVGCEGGRGGGDSPTSYPSVRDMGTEREGGRETRGEEGKRSGDNGDQESFKR